MPQLIDKPINLTTGHHPVIAETRELTQPEIKQPIIEAKKESITDVLNQISKAQELIDRTPIPVEPLQHSFYDSSKIPTQSIIQKIRLHYPNVMNVVAVILHSAAASFPFIPFISENFAKDIKQKAIFFSRYIVPINMFHNAIEALSKKRLFEGLARLPVPFLMPFLPFFNFKLPYGIFAGINFPNEEIVKRVGELNDKATFSQNNKKILDGLKMMWQELFDNKVSDKQRFKTASILTGTFCMLFGAVNSLIFAPKSLNNLPATVFGFLRSIGGLIGDTVLIATGDAKEKLIGTLYAVGSFMDITQRWITNPAVNELYNHAKTSLDTISTMLWTHFSTQRNMSSSQSRNLSPSLAA